MDVKVSVRHPIKITMLAKEEIQPITRRKRQSIEMNTNMEEMMDISRY